MNVKETYCQSIRERLYILCILPQLRQKKKKKKKKSGKDAMSTKIVNLLATRKGSSYLDFFLSHYKVALK